MSWSTKNRPGPSPRKRYEFSEDVEARVGRSWVRKTDLECAIRDCRRVRVTREEGGITRVVREWQDGERVYTNVGKRLD